MAKPNGTKKAVSKKGGGKKGGSKKGGSRKPATNAAAAGPGVIAVPAAISALSAMTEPEHIAAELSSSQCIIWRLGEFRQRVRQAVANWAEESSVSASDTLGALAKGTPWNTGQQGQLVSSVNAQKVFEPPFPGTVMSAPSQLVPASTTVLQWESIVWRHQNPLTPCFPFTD